jgi:hypothetical protein
LAAIAENLAAVRHRMAEAARRAARPAEAVTLIAVSKTQPPEAVRQALAAGQRDFGENRVQEALAKMDAVGPGPGAGSGPRWHLIGHLQTNKAKLIAGRFDTVHTVDSARVAEALNAHPRAGAATPAPLKVLLQLNLTREPTKSGVADWDGLCRLLEAVRGCAGLLPVGLMTVPDPALSEAETRAHFAQVRGLLERLQRDLAPGPAFRELSMGMSHDFEWAIEEGATAVRVGTAIFGQRAQPHGA